MTVSVLVCVLVCVFVSVVDNLATRKMFLDTCPSNPGSPGLCGYLVAIMTVSVSVCVLICVLVSVLFSVMFLNTSLQLWHFRALWLPGGHHNGQYVG